ncbi:hypothetical protein FRC08_000421 [Ceratobasidium sp. 394]|nr:hypothetical protein FRC08_000421 [Ceratobasidium sp. 394]
MVRIQFTEHSQVIDQYLGQVVLDFLLIFPERRWQYSGVVDALNEAEHDAELKQTLRQWFNNQLRSSYHWIDTAHRPSNVRDSSLIHDSSPPMLSAIHNPDDVRHELAVYFNMVYRWMGGTDNFVETGIAQDMDTAEP